MPANNVFLPLTYALATALIAANLLFSPQVARADSVLTPTKSFGIKVSKETAKTASQNLDVYGFLPFWMLEKNLELNYEKLTDIAYFGFTVEATGKINKRDGGYTNWRNNEKLAEIIKEAQDKNIRVGVTIISHNDAVSTAFLNCTTCWDVFTDELEEELRFHAVSAINFDFEYAGLVSKDLALKYTDFISHVAARLPERGIKPYVVVSTYADSAIRDRVTDINSLAKVSDKLFIMAYDFHYVKSTTAGPLAPVTGAPSNYMYDLTTMLADYKTSISPQQLILGMGFYGYSWETESMGAYAKTVLGEAAQRNDEDAEAEAGKSYAKIYSQIVDTLRKNNARVYWNTKALAPYAIYKNPEKETFQVIHYENRDSLQIKANLAKDNQLGGVGIWALGYEGNHKDLWKAIER